MSLFWQNLFFRFEFNGLKLEQRKLIGIHDIGTSLLIDQKKTCNLSLFYLKRPRMRYERKNQSVHGQVQCMICKDNGVTKLVRYE
ncbi:hypothetical protein BpHYR1_042768 [Brachionus plicatilis]|uniref:Uncharacterized protein n=1 Tax=Brachionus plicatilis TaxID=10195 RepID=A0A3M7SBV5_BRAPC|nr:hypothetical protein BpHYR1_042768 [Brachionus plicatilis]